MWFVKAPNSFFEERKKSMPSFSMKVVLTFVVTVVACVVWMLKSSHLAKVATMTPAANPQAATMTPVRSEEEISIHNFLAKTTWMMGEEAARDIPRRLAGSCSLEAITGLSNQEFSLIHIPPTLPPKERTAWESSHPTKNKTVLGGQLYQKFFLPTVLTNWCVSSHGRMHPARGWSPKLVKVLRSALYVVTEVGKKHGWNRLPVNAVPPPKCKHSRAFCECGGVVQRTAYVHPINAA